tara:strand:+ start:14912 stop:15115 length:204 start_codon:yes stop_codon:yes gene_type:complete
MKVDVRNGNVDTALRILKKKLQEDGFYTEIRERERFKSKGEKRRLEKAAGRRRYLKSLEKRKIEIGY